MAMISGLSGRKSSTGSPTSPINAEKLESEGKGARVFPGACDGGRLLVEEHFKNLGFSLGF